MKPLDLRRRHDFEPPVWIVPVALVVFVLVALFLWGCASDIPTLAGDDVDAGELDGLLGDAPLETSTVDVAGDALETPADSSPVDVGEDTRPDSAPCVKRCLVDGGVPLGYFCSKASDCCSGRCETKCQPSADPTWKECP